MTKKKFFLASVAGGIMAAGISVSAVSVVNAQNPNGRVNFRAPDPETIFARMDTNGDQMISKPEFMAAHARMKERSQERRQMRQERRENRNQPQ